jgi:hypothetical protein
MKRIIKSAFSKSCRYLFLLSLPAFVIFPDKLPVAYAADNTPSASQSGLKTGDEYGGGKLVYIFRQGDAGYVAGQLHGLVAAKEDLSQSLTWQQAIAACREYRGGGFSNWRLPSKEELNMLYTHRFAIGGFTERYYYWTSTESDRNDAWDQSFRTGEHNLGYKLDSNFARPVRVF